LAVVVEQLAVECLEMQQRVVLEVVVGLILATQQVRQERLDKEILEETLPVQPEIILVPAAEGPAP
jgi:hypothetical protein